MFRHAGPPPPGCAARAPAAGASLAASIAASSGRGSVAVIGASFRAKGGTECPCFARVSPVRACGGAGGRIAAARFAHVIARARRHTHLARPFPPGSFSRPQPVVFCRKAERRPPGSRLSLLSFYHTSPQVKPIREQKMKMAAIFHGMPAAGTRAGPRIDADAPFGVTVKAGISQPVPPPEPVQPIGLLSALPRRSQGPTDARSAKSVSAVSMAAP